MLWHCDHHEDVLPSYEEVVAHVSQLSSAYSVVRLRLAMRVTLGDDETKGDFMTKLHSFYSEAKAQVPKCLGLTLLLDS